MMEYHHCPLSALYQCDRVVPPAGLVCELTSISLCPSESVEQAVEKYNVQRVTLLREIAIKTGIQVSLPAISSLHERASVVQSHPGQE